MPDKPPIGAALLKAAIGSALPRHSGLAEITAQQARLRTGAMPGLQDALAAPPPPPPTLPETDAQGRPLSASQWQELGLTLAALGNARLATEALHKATSQDPTLTRAWTTLRELRKSTGDTEGIAACAVALASCPPAKPAKPAARPTATLQAAEREFGKRIQEGKPEEAGGMLRRHLRSDPVDAAALRLLAEIGVRNNRLPESEKLLERALELAPDYLPARRDYASVLLMRNRHAEALPHLRWATAQEPQDVQHHLKLALCLGNLGDYDEAMSLYEAAIEDVFSDPPFLLNYAHCLLYTGRRGEGVQAYRACLEYAPESGEAWWGLANIKNERFSDDDVAAMLASLAGDGMAPVGRIHTHYALGTALEQKRDYGESFSHYARGAALQRTQFQYNADDTTSQVARQKAFYTGERFAAFTGSGDPDPAPIFILGMPRAGSTLIEQILASHSLVEGTRELPEINFIARDLGAHGDPARALEGLSGEEFAALGRRYIERCRVYRKTDRPQFIDKMPSNWLQIGLIQHILPNARIIDARRHPMANCFSNFKQLFGGGAYYTYSLSDLGRFYGDYVDWMAHVDRMLPGRVHRVIYEKLVDDMEGEIRTLLAHCGLPFEDGCLRFWESKRAVATPSSEQVRQPIYRDGLEQWRHYAAFLAPLQAALDKGPAAGWLS